MRAIETPCAGLLVLEPKVWEDDRGFFFESFNQQTFERVTGIKKSFLQDNHSHSKYHAVHGLHYQIKRPQGKLVRVVNGEIYDVSLDIRRKSSTFGKWFGIKLSAENKKMIWIPEGYAHGFMVLSEEADILYKTTDYWAPEHERCIKWNDADLAINWPIPGAPILTPKDAAGKSFCEAEVYA